MLFNSLEFFLFLPLVFAFYWGLGPGRRQAQNVLIWAASYAFYAWWDWRFLGLIVLTSFLDFTLGRLMADTPVAQRLRRRLMLGLSLTVNLGILVFFKYYNFFVENLVAAFAAVGIGLEPATLHVILPVGISFYTFQSMTYTIEVYRGQLTPTRNLAEFCAFHSFFPQMMAGPIERATHLLPQFQRPRRFDAALAADGLRQMLWGLAKKVIVADTLAQEVNRIYSNLDAQPASVLAVGAVLFAFQIYGDFSGYSDIAVGSARLFGFELMRNFAYPYFSQNIGEFWRRWHISLSTWFRDYVYIPLGGNRGGRWGRFRNLMITFTVSGLWHGANWTFVVWGALNGLFHLPQLLRGKAKEEFRLESGARPGLGVVAGMVWTFALTCLAWVFFRAESITQAFDYLRSMADASLFTLPSNLRYVAAIVPLVVVEWLQRRHAHGLVFPARWPRVARWAVYLLLAVLVVVFFGRNSAGQSFIYFQF